MTSDRGRRPARHVAFLRAVNVGGRGVVRMADVAAAFAAAGAAGVRTFIQSGNVLFDAPAGGLAALRPALHREMARLLNAEPVIVFRTLRDVEALVEEAPFGRRTQDASLKLYVVFLAAAPARTPAFPLRLPREALEAIGMRGRDVLLVSRRKPNGMYGFPANWIESELGAAATARNWSTVWKLVEWSRR